ncbi:DUF4249 domain-containing protein [Telluribacter humicola]|uniref:DUF4249 domain-containing protein n=1 Tax=Telluribacter humicola TaxID=1720261 RepID=UPI001A9648E1|nr:DUF4249 domain-containing protein [Telluribacter humicola]
MLFLVQVLLITGIWGCQEDTYELGFAGPELIINGVLVAGESPRISVGKTWPATGQIPEKPYVEDAQVELLEGGQPVGMLTYLSNGTYGLSSYKIEAGKTYTVRVQGLGMQAQSRPVRVPLPFPLQHSYMDYQAKVTSLNDWAKPHLLRVGIKDYQEPGNYYGVAVTPFIKGELKFTNVSNIEVSNSGLNNREDDCFTRAGFWNGEFIAIPNSGITSTMILYNDACFAKQEKEFGIVIETLVAYGAEDLVNNTIDELRLQMAVLSPEYVAYAKTQYKPEGPDNAFIEPKRTYTNIEGGHGVVAAMNLVRKSVQVRLPPL